GDGHGSLTYSRYMFFFSSRRRHTRSDRDWSSDVCSSDLKLLLLGHAFDTLGCKVVGLRTDNFNFPSQRAIEALGARKDGVIRHRSEERRVGKECRARGGAEDANASRRLRTEARAAQCGRG